MTAFMSAHPWATLIVGYVIGGNVGFLFAAMLASSSAVQTADDEPGLNKDSNHVG